MAARPVVVMQEGLSSRILGLSRVVHSRIREGLDRFAIQDIWMYSILRGGQDLLVVL